MKNKKTIGKTIGLVLALLFVIGAAVFGSVYAYWIGTVNKPSNKLSQIEVTVGQGKTVDDVIFTIGSITYTPNNKKLVPAGKGAYSNDETNCVETIKVTIPVKISSAKLNGYTLSPSDPEFFKRNVTCTIKSKKFETDATHSALIGTSIKNADENADGTTQEVVINNNEFVNYVILVTLTEPNSKDVYDAVAGKQINIEVEFSSNK